MAGLVGLIETFLLGDFGTPLTWLTNDKLKVAALILYFNLCEMPKVNLSHTLSICNISFKEQESAFLYTSTLLG